MIERSLGVTALSLAKDRMIAGNIGMKNELRMEMGGSPSTMLNNSNKTVGQYRNTLKTNERSKMRCSRTSRNELVDLYEFDETVEEKKLIVEGTKSNKTKMKKRIMMKLLVMY